MLSSPLLDTYTDVVNTTYTLVPNFIGGTAQIQLPSGAYATGTVTTGQLLGRTVLLGTNTYTLRVTNATGVATKTFTVTGTAAAIAAPVINTFGGRIQNTTAIQFNLFATVNTLYDIVADFTGGTA